MVNKMKKFAVGIFVIGIIFVSLGFYKKNVYENGEYSWSQQKNAYVGGDAYNYIINANYFTGYIDLGGFLFVTSSILMATGCIIEKLEPISSITNVEKKESTEENVA